MASNDQNASGSGGDDGLGEFRREMDGVRPLKPMDKVNLPRKPVLDPQRAARRQQRAVEADEALRGVAPAQGGVSDDYVEMLKPDTLLAFKRPGVQEGVYRKLRLGKYPLQARLDLHRKTVKQARREVFEFVHECEQHDLRCLLVLHGKGERDPDPERQAVLKSHVAKWLQEIPQVLAFHSAQKNHGGAGAVYVLLRKSERMKELTRELHGKRG